jgi:Protein of unknown function (DUF2721)
VSGFSPAQAMIAAMITPALLIMASASLIATVLVRLARVVDRVRKLSETREAARDVGEISRHKRRALLAERALILYFCAVACFVIGGFAIAVDHAFGDRLIWLPVLVTTLGMCLIVAGSAAMLGECRLAFAQIRAELAALT